MTDLQVDGIEGLKVNRYEQRLRGLEALIADHERQLRALTARIEQLVATS
jgi:hypothetical protein